MAIPLDSSWRRWLAKAVAPRMAAQAERCGHLQHFMAQLRSVATDAPEVRHTVCWLLASADNAMLPPGRRPDQGGYPLTQPSSLIEWFRIKRRQQGQSWHGHGRRL